MYCFKNYIFFQNNSSNVNSTITSIVLLDEWLQKSNTWLWFGIVGAIILFIILLVLFVIRKRIAIAIAIVVEGSKYVEMACSNALMLIVCFVLQIIVI